MVFEMSIVVRQEDLDELDHVNNVRYVQWIQDVSRAHWESRASAALRERYVWVVKQHLIRYRNSAKLGDSVFIRTYIEKTEGAISTRVVEMQVKKSELPLLRSETEWCLLDGKSLRPKRIPEEIKTIFGSTPKS